MDVTTIDTTALADELLAKARDARAGRAAKSLRSGPEVTLRHAMMALTAGSSMADHENPGEATLLVVRGRVTLEIGDESFEASAGDFVDIPDARHGLTAREDTVGILTTVPR